MSFNSPGQGSSPWSAFLPMQELSVEAFLNGGVRNIPVALVPTNGGEIRRNNPQAIQVDLQGVTPHFKKISEVRPFGRGGILVRSSDQACVMDLLACTQFSSVPVRAFIPPHLACSKGIVRGVSKDLSPPEVLNSFAAAGAISVFRCSRTVNDKKMPTESVIVTFAGITCPSEIRAWPLLFRVEPLQPRPFQCHKCWRYGHSIKGCKSSSRCVSCGGAHAASECQAAEPRCCLCQGSHPADYSNCPARAQETSVLEIIEKRRCSRGEAVAAVKERARGYATVASRQDSVSEQSISSMINASVVNSMTTIVQPLIGSLSECMSQMQAMTQKMAEFLQMFSAISSGSQLQAAGIGSIVGAASGKPPSLTKGDLAEAAPSSASAHLAPLPPSASLPGGPRVSPATPLENMPSPPNENAAVNDLGQFPVPPEMSSACVEDSDEMEVGQSSPPAQKRRLSPTDEEVSKASKTKNNKNAKSSLQSTNQPHDILQQAISSAQLG